MMAKLIDTARDIAKDSGDRDRKVCTLFMAWLTEEGEVTTALSTNRLGLEEGWTDDYHRFIDRAIEALKNSKIKY
jgi:hypothetical protein